MAKTLANLHAFGDLDNGVWFAPLGTAAPTDPTASLPADWVELGWIDDAGLTESDSVQETEKYGWQGATLLRTLRSQLKHSFQFNCLEENAAVYGLRYPGADTTTATGVNTTVVKPSTSQNFKSFVIQRNDGDVHHRIYIGQGEVTGSGDIVYKADDLTIFAFTLNCYVDDDGNWFTDLNDNTALAEDES